MTSRGPALLCRCRCSLSLVEEGSSSPNISGPAPPGPVDACFLCGLLVGRSPLPPTAARRPTSGSRSPQGTGHSRGSSASGSTPAPCSWRRCSSGSPCTWRRSPCGAHFPTGPLSLEPTVFRATGMPLHLRAILLPTSWTLPPPCRS
jgi:hypothetical protein